MNIEDEHWEYTKKIIMIGMIIASKIDYNEEDYEQILNGLEVLYKESFRHGFKHCKEDKK